MGSNLETLTKLEHCRKENTMKNESAVNELLKVLKDHAHTANQYIEASRKAMLTELERFPKEQPAYSSKYCLKEYNKECKFINGMITAAEIFGYEIYWKNGEPGTFKGEPHIREKA